MVGPANDKLGSNSAIVGAIKLPVTGLVLSLDSVITHRRGASVGAGVSIDAIAVVAFFISTVLVPVAASIIDAII
jgi:hypothetical protein